MSKFRTYITTNNSHGKPVTTGNCHSAHLHGKTGGVEIVAGTTDDDCDQFEVSMTDGTSPGRVLGLVMATPDGPMWIPAGPPALVPAGNHLRDWPV